MKNVVKIIEHVRLRITLSLTLNSWKPQIWFLETQGNSYHFLKKLLSSHARRRHSCQRAVQPQHGGETCSFCLHPKASVRWFGVPHFDHRRSFSLKLYIQKLLQPQESFQKSAQQSATYSAWCGSPASSFARWRSNSRSRSSKASQRAFS